MTRLNLVHIFLFFFVSVIGNACTGEARQGLEVVRTYEDGSVRMDRRYTEKGHHRHYELQREFYQGGALFKEGPLSGDTLANGRWKSYYEDGTLWSEGDFRQGVRNGITRTNYANGALYYEGWFTEGRKDSIWRFYRSDGSFIKEVDFSK